MKNEKMLLAGCVAAGVIGLAIGFSLAHLHSKNRKKRKKDEDLRTLIRELFTKGFIQEYIYKNWTEMIDSGKYDELIEILEKEVNELVGE